MMGGLSASQRHCRPLAKGSAPSSCSAKRLSGVNRVEQRAPTPQPCPSSRLREARGLRLAALRLVLISVWSIT